MQDVICVRIVTFGAMAACEALCGSMAGGILILVRG